jgi:two-component system sensor histidine kinase KdpD
MPAHTSLEPRASEDHPRTADALAMLDALAADGPAEARLDRALATLERRWSCPCGVTLHEPIYEALGLPGAPAPAPGTGRRDAAGRSGAPLEWRGEHLGTLWVDGAAPRELEAIAHRLARWLAAERAAERRRREILRLERSDGLKTALMRGVSHEFRSPLTAIANAGAALAVVEDPSERLDLLDGLRQECGRLERLVDNLLDLSRLEGGVLRARLDWCSPEELIGGAVRAAGAVLGDARLETDLDGAVSLVRADAVMTERILVNLLHNAVRHGRPPVRIATAVEGGDLALRVADAGPGVDARVLPRVFEPFVHREGEGLGLGLPLSRRLADAQGARLEHRSGPGGACFVLLLPLSEPPAVAA